MQSTLKMDDLKITNKNKRRSKNDTKDRNYKCGCGKNYLSYPALYTHIKQKHDGHEPTGTQSTQLKSGRGRGRPRKIFVADEIIQDNDLEENKEQDQFNEAQSALISVFIQQDENLSTINLNEFGGKSDPVRDWFTSDTADGQISSTKINQAKIKLLIS